MKPISIVLITAVAFAAPPVSIRLADPAHMVIGADRVTATGMTLRELIMDAHGIQSYQVSGGPDWVATQRFNIEVNSSGAPDLNSLRYLLAERFRLSAHHETREQDVYNLVVAPGGVKFRTGGSVEIASLASYLSQSVGKPVIDKTGLTGAFDLNLGVTPEDLGLQLIPGKAPIETIVIDHAEMPSAN